MVDHIVCVYGKSSFRSCPMSSSSPLPFAIAARQRNSDDADQPFQRISGLKEGRRRVRSANIAEFQAAGAVVIDPIVIAVSVGQFPTMATELGF
jgi:hypothetical protein